MSVATPPLSQYAFKRPDSEISDAVKWLQFEG